MLSLIKKIFIKQKDNSTTIILSNGSCPSCQSKRAIIHTRYDNRQWYICDSCGKLFCIKY